MDGLMLIENGIVPIYESKSDEQVINARELYLKLESKWRFNDWIKDRLDKYGFIENEDFYRIISKSTGGRPA